MIQEDKEIQLNDLCARLPYGTKVRAFIGEKNENDEILGCVHIFNFYSHNCKPYLRPRSSMTEEEKKIYQSKQTIIFDFKNNKLYVDNCYSLDYLNSIYVDYRGLIEKELALEAPEGMYNI